MGDQLLDRIDQYVKKEFEANRRVLSFDEYLEYFSMQAEGQMRGSAQYMLDMMDFYGKFPVSDTPGAKPLEENDPNSTIYRFKIFDHPISGLAPKVVGQEEVQTEIYRSLKSFARQGINNRLILLHGPNGSAKSTIIHGLMSGMERYAKEDEGAVYTFHWIFPVERATKGEIGFSSYSKKDDSRSYANLRDEDIGTLIPGEMKDHPILLIPQEQRRKFVTELLGVERANKLWESLPWYLSNGDLSHRSKEIYEALLGANRGDYRQVLKHVRVERFFYSRRYRHGLVTIEPQLHVDANYSLLTMDKNLTSLPAALQSISLFTLTGDLIDGNRGIVEFSDLLKRPVDTFKYLLTACETSSVNVGQSIAYLDSVLLGSSNELQLDAFKEFPDFSSFKARIKLILVPYLLAMDQEKEIYDLVIDQAGLEKHVTPHVSWCLSYWAVLTRLKKPNSINYSPNVSSLISSLNPQQKARLYNRGE